MEKSRKFEKVRGYYQSGLWTRQMVLNAADRWITQEEAREIVGEAQEE